MPLTATGKFLRLAVIAAVVVVIAGVFAYASAWLSPQRLTQARMISAFEKANGVYPGFRRNHAKGVCVSGWFEGSGQALAVSRAEIFKSSGRAPVVGRFALAAGVPFPADSAAIVRSMALRLQTPDGAEWRTGMNNIPVFPVNSAQGFYDLLAASTPDPATGKPDPAAMPAFLTRHPEAARAMAIIKQRAVTPGFAESTYNSLNAFRLINAAGVSTAVRWAMVPVPPTPIEAAAASAAGNQPEDKNAVFDALIAQLHHQPLQWHLLLTIAQRGDPTQDATLAWPDDRQRIDAGTLTLDKIFSEDGGACTDINYDPLVLPPGIEPSDDPLLSARSSAYARSFRLRAGEKDRKAPSAVTAQEVRGDAS